MRVVLRDESTGRETVAEGQVGQSLLQIALAAGVSIEHTCGGVGACSTCHVRIRQGRELLCEADDNELDRLDEAPGVGLDSRLACQARLVKEGSVVCEIPRWNRNLVKEG